MASEGSERITIIAQETWDTAQLIDYYAFQSQSLWEERAYTVLNWRDETITSKIDKLAPDDLAQYRALSGPTPNQDRTDLEIFHANSISLGQMGKPADKKCIFLQASRFNHRCLPNAYYTWNSSPPGYITVNAMVPIQKDEEIFINYIGQGETELASREQRQEALRQWNINCDCLLCTEYRLESDQRRQTMQTLQASIGRNQDRYNNDQQPALTNQERAAILQDIRTNSYHLHDLCVPEGIIYPTRAEALQWIANSYTMAAELEGCHPIYKISCYNNAVEILRSKLDLDVVCNGHDSPEVKETLEYLGEFCEHVREQDEAA